MIVWSKRRCFGYFAVAIADDQVCYLINLGIPAIAITNVKDSDIILQVLMETTFICSFWFSRAFVVFTVWRGNF